MDRVWVEGRSRDAEKRFNEERADLFSKIESFCGLSDEWRDRLSHEIDGGLDSGYLGSLESAVSLCVYDMCHLRKKFIYLDSKEEEIFKKIDKFLRSLNISNLSYLFYEWHNSDRYLDSEPMFFDGDIIITDPCYIRKDYDFDWYNLENYNIIGMSRDTLYGDWGCTVYDLDTKEPIGEFCADAGMVSVLNLGSVLKYNPNFDYHINRKWTTALIRNFKGEVKFTVEFESGVYEDTTDYHKVGDKWEDFSVHVVGNGVDRVTKKPINFYSTQTSL